eukprot:3532117-Rhodomonas_salina.2
MSTPSEWNSKFPRQQGHQKKSFRFGPRVRIQVRAAQTAGSLGSPRTCARPWPEATSFWQ